MSTPPPRARRRRWPWIVGGSALFVVLLVAPQIWAFFAMGRSGPPDESLICRDNAYEASQAMDDLPDGGVLRLSDLTDFEWDAVYLYNGYNDLDEMADTMDVDTGPDFSNRRVCAFSGLYFVKDRTLVHVFTFRDQEYIPDFGPPGTRWGREVEVRRQADGARQVCEGTVCA